MAANPHVVAVPYPGRGHINPMLNFCKLMALKKPDIHIIVIVTEEWFGYLNSDHEEDITLVESDSKISFKTIPNVLPSEATRGSDLAGFLEAVQMDMEMAVERVLDMIEVPIDLIIADGFLDWGVELGNRRNTQVSSFWPPSLSAFLLVHQHEHIHKLLSESGGEERVRVPGLPPIRKMDLPGALQPNNKRMSSVVVKLVSSATKAQCIIFRTLKELEAEAIHALKANISCPIFTIGPAIPYFKTTPRQNSSHCEPNYISWLNSQNKGSILYVSLGSFMSTSSSQTEELAAGLKASGVSFLWVSKNPAFQSSCNRGMVVPWCDQMRVLCHPSIGGFLTHCGWNSTLETVFAAVPALTFPLGADQFLNSKMIVEDWGVGWRVKNGVDEFVRREAISELLKRFMDLDCNERVELDRSCKELQARVFESVGEDGSTSDFDGFLSRIHNERQPMSSSRPPPPPQNKPPLWR